MLRSTSTITSTSTSTITRRIRGARLNMAGDTLRQHLRRIRRRLVLCEGVSGGSWGLIAAVGLLLLAMWLDLLWELSPHLRVTSVVLAAVVAPIVWMAFGWHIVSRGRGQLLARRMDRVAGT